MADEREQQDPPWGRPEDDDETVISGEQPSADEAEEAYHDEPEASAEEEQDTEEHEADDEQGTDARVTSEPEQDQDDDEYKWHTGRKREHGSSDAVEFIDVVKAFGRNTVLNGLNLGLPDDQISMILGPSGTGKSVCIKHMVGLLYPDEGDVLVHGESVPNMADDDLFEMRK